MSLLKKTLLTISAFSLIAIVACSDDDDKTPDGSTTKDSGADAAVTKDGTPDKKVATGDQKVVDQAPTPDQLVTPPAKDLQPYKLDGAYKVLYRFADPTTKGASAFNIGGGKVYVYELGGASKAGKVSVGTLVAKTGKLGTLSTVFSFTPTISGTLFAGSYVALSPKAFVAAGYTESKTFAGEIYWGDKGIKTAKKIDKAKGNFDVAFLTDTTLLINGTGLGKDTSGQGVYVYEEGKTPRRLIKDLGIASGAMVVGTQTVYAGGYFTGGNKIYGFSVAEIKNAITANKTLSASTDGDLVSSASYSDAAALGDDLVLATLDKSWKFKAVTFTPMTIAGDKVTAGNAKDMVTGSATSSVTKLGGGGKQLALYLSNGSMKEIAIIVKK